MPFIVFESGPDKGRAIELKPGTLYTAGQDPECQITITDELVALRHFKIKEHEGKYYIRDLDTESGVLVNDTRTVQAELNLGDKIQVGATFLTFAQDARGDPLIGRSVAGYRILDRLGRGGMGTVYLAEQLSLNRQVAIKRLSPRLTRDAAFRERFMQEARAAGAFNHPNVLQVYDVIHEGDLCFYSMEYIPGGTVEDLINKGEVPVDQALRIVKDAARGLVYAEQKQIVHHDIKPQNLMITELRSVKISDMGLAASLTDSSKEGTSGGLIGTPHFISPERIQRKELDIRSDIYSLGCTFYMILAGKTPFRGNKVREILIKQIKEEPTPIRELRPDVPEAFWRMIQRMMAKDPEDRPASAAELLRELDELKTAGKKGPVVAAVAAVVLIAGGAALYLVSQSGNEAPPVNPGATGGQNQGAIEDTQLKEKMKDLQKEMLEAKASNAYLSIPDSLVGEDRIARLEEIISEYEGTPTAEQAGKEVLRIRERLDAERAAERARLEKIAALESSVDPALEGYFKEGGYGDALAFALALGAAEGIADEEEVIALRSKAVQRIQEACTKENEALLAKAESLFAEHKYGEARAELESARARFRIPEKGLPPKEKSILDGIDAKISSSITAAARAERDYYRALYDGDRDTLLSSLSPRKIRAAVTAYRFRRAEEAFAGLIPDLKTRAYQEHVGMLRADLDGAARLLERFEAAVQQGQLLEDAVDNPDEMPGAESSINGLTDEGDGLKILVTRGKRSYLSNVAYARFANGAGLAHLLSGRFEMDASDHMALARAMLHFTSAQCAARLSPLETAAEAYDPKHGWSKEVRLAATVTPLPFEGRELIESLAKEAASQDPALAEASRALLARIDREAAAVEALHQCLAPFLQEEPAYDFSASLAALEAFARNYADTVFFWYALDLVEGPGAKGRHLVEFAR